MFIVFFVGGIGRFNFGIGSKDVSDEGKCSVMVKGFIFFIFRSVYYKVVDGNGGYVGGSYSYGGVIDGVFG